MKQVPKKVDVAIIGAGPSGAIASALLVKKGFSVVVLEKSRFPRFSIGESLLPQCMEYLQEADMLDAVKVHGFQYKDGAVFSRNNESTVFDFGCQFTPGWSNTFQVQRADFDKILADCAEKIGVPIFYGHEITHVKCAADMQSLRYKSITGEEGLISAKFVLDASGFARVLPRLLNLESPSNFPVRKAIFTHIVDNITDPGYDRKKILVTVHPELVDVWYWLIPFSNGTASLGVVAEPEVFEKIGSDAKTLLQVCVNDEPRLKNLLNGAEYNSRMGEIIGYAANVKSLYGPGYALLGNAGEFLDPVFSSGVTIAMKSASMAVKVLEKQLLGKEVDWSADYESELKLGIDTFRTFVTAWYDGSFQKIIFSADQNIPIKEMICSILAGYAWDQSNPYVSSSNRRLDALSQVCETQ